MRLEVRGDCVFLRPLLASGPAGVGEVEPALVVPGGVHHVDQAVDVEIGLGRGRGADVEGLARKTDVKGLTVGVGVDRHRPDAHLLARPDDPDRDLTPVRDQDLLEQLLLPLTYGSRP